MQTNFQVVRMKQKECVRVHARIPYKYAIGNARQLIMSNDCVTQAGRFELHAPLWDRIRRNGQHAVPTYRCAKQESVVFR